jgi:hypothetical protein
MEKQIEDTMKKAFYDLIDENTSSSTPDYDWIVSLYSEIKASLMHFLKKGSLVYNRIDESFDVELFSQMIRADVFSSESMVKLIENTFFWIKELGAPARDKEVDDAKKRVLQTPLNKIISVYLKETHECLCHYQQDMVEYLQKL